MTAITSCWLWVRFLSEQKPDCRCLGSLARQYLEKYMKSSKIPWPIFFFLTEKMSSPSKPWYMAASFVGLQHGILGLSLALDITCVSLKISSLQRDFLRSHNPGNPHFYIRCAKSEAEAGESRGVLGKRQQNVGWQGSGRQHGTVCPSRLQQITHFLVGWWD